MNLDLFLATLRARGGVFTLVLVVTVLAAAVVSLLLPETYRATAALLVDVKDEQSLSNVLRPLMLPQERMNYMQTQMDIITSQKVAQKVVRDLKLAEGPKARASFENEAEGAGSIEEWLADNLLKRLKVETSQSSIIQVSYSSRDPHFSAAVANAFGKAYLDTLLELRVEPTRQAAAWFDEQMKSLRASLEDAQAKLTDYQRQRGIVSPDERYDVENTRLGELSTQLAKAQDQTFDWESRVRRAREYLERGAPPDQLPDVLNNPYIQKTATDLLDGEAKLQELATQYGANYPLYQRQLSENQARRERLDAAMRKVVAGLENSRRQSLRREAELRNAMAALRAQLLENKVDRNELAVLARNVETAQRTYDIALQRSVVSQVESRASQTNVTVLTPAVAPRRPDSPRITLNVALAAVVGIMLGIATVILSEMFDRRVRLVEDLAGGLGAPLLAALNRQHPSAPPLLGHSGGGRRSLPSPG